MTAYICYEDNISIREKIYLFAYEQVFSKLGDDICIKYNTYGKPYLLGGDIYFSISYAADVGIIIFEDRPIGIDIEKIASIDKRIVYRFFSNKEKEYVLEEENVIRQREKFFEIWTKKEAYVKCLGIGLKGFFDEFDVFNYAGLNRFCSIKERDCIISIYTIKEVDRLKIIYI